MNAYVNWMTEADALRRNCPQRADQWINMRGKCVGQGCMAWRWLGDSRTDEPLGNCGLAPRS